MQNYFTLILLSLSLHSFAQKIEDLPKNTNQSSFKQTLFADTTAESYSNLGEINIQQKKYNTAYTFFTKAINKAPQAKYFCKRGTCLVLQNKPTNALADFDSAIKADPNCTEAYFFKGTIYQFNADSYNALKNYSKAIEINPAYADAYLMRAMVYGSIKKDAEACKDLKKAAGLGNKKAMEQLNKLCK